MAPGSLPLPPLLEVLSLFLIRSSDALNICYRAGAGRLFYKGPDGKYGFAGPTISASTTQLYQYSAKQGSH